MELGTYYFQIAIEGKDWEDIPQIPIEDIDEQEAYKIARFTSALFKTKLRLEKAPYYQGRYFEDGKRI